MKGSSMIACAVALLMSATAVNADFTVPEPTGFDKVKFGMSLEEVRKAYPEMKKLEGKAGGLMHPKIERYSVAQHKLAGLEKPTDIDLQFWNGKFWLGLIHFGDNDPAKVDAYIQKTYGDPGYNDENYKTWNGKTAGAVMAKKQKTFEVHDEGMSNEARRELFQGKKMQSSMQVQGTPPAAPATPKAAATAK